MSFFHGNYFAWCSLLLQMSFSSQLQLTFDISNRQYLELSNEIFGPVVTPYAYKLKIIRYLEFRYISRISRYLERFLRSIGIKSLVISGYLELSFQGSKYFCIRYMSALLTPENPTWTNIPYWPFLRQPLLALFWNFLRLLFHKVTSNAGPNSVRRK